MVTILVLSIVWLGNSLRVTYHSFSEIFKERKKSDIN